MSNASYPMKLIDFCMKYNKTEILLKVALNTITLIMRYNRIYKKEKYHNINIKEKNINDLYNISKFMGRGLFLQRNLSPKFMERKLIDLKDAKKTPNNLSL